MDEWVLIAAQTLESEVRMAQFDEDVDWVFAMP